MTNVIENIEFPYIHLIYNTLKIQYIFNSSGNVPDLKY